MTVWATADVGLHQGGSGEGGRKWKGHSPILKVNFTLTICSWDCERNGKLKNLF